MLLIATHKSSPRIHLSQNIVSEEAFKKVASMLPPSNTILTSLQIEKIEDLSYSNMCLGQNGNALKYIYYINNLLVSGMFAIVSIIKNIDYGAPAINSVASGYKFVLF